MNECQSVPEDEDFRQGDIFLSHPQDNGQTDHIHIVITADCDIAQKKAGPSLSWLPIVPAEGYVETFWMQEKVAKLESRLRNHITSLVNILHKRLNAEAIELDEGFVVDWAVSDNGKAIILSLSPNPEEHDKLIKYIAALNRISIIYSAKSCFKEVVNSFYDLQHEAGLVQDVPKAKSRFSDIRSVLADARQDAFFLSAVPGKDTNGWVIKLREIENVPVSRLVQSRSDWYLGEDRHLRIGRLSPVYKYAVSQQFGSLFSRIGLPGDYAQWRNLVIDDVCNTLYPMGA